MDEDHTASPAPNTGKIESQEGAVRVTGDSVSDIAASSRQAANSFEQLLRSTIEQQPYTAIAIALGIGWLLGRSHRPL